MIRSVTTPRFATCDLRDAHKNDSSGKFRVLGAGQFEDYFWPCTGFRPLSNARIPVVGQ